jgi:hypothetical protein
MEGLGACAEQRIVYLANNSVTNDASTFLDGETKALVQPAMLILWN